MPVIAVVNRKGGSGKSTMATNIAAWCAHNGWQVMLGGVDRQRSMHSWLSRRPTAVPEVSSWAVDRSRVLRPPAGTTHVVLDTPGALYDHDLAKLVINVDALVVPIGPSLFDRDASLQFLAELKQLPRVSSGRCRLVAVGMRWPAEKRAAWLGNGRQWDAPLLTVIPELAVYRTSLETGGSIFDLPEEAIETETEPWRPLLSWLRVVWSEGYAPRKPAGRLDAAEDAQQLALEGFGAVAGVCLAPAVPAAPAATPAAARPALAAPEPDSPPAPVQAAPSPPPGPATAAPVPGQDVSSRPVPVRRSWWQRLLGWR